VITRKKSQMDCELVMTPLINSKRSTISNKYRSGAITNHHILTAIGVHLDDMHGLRKSNFSSNNTYQS